MSSDQQERQKSYPVPSEDEIRAKLSDDEYRILRQKGTERAFTGALLDNKSEGVYICKVCAMPLFNSDSKYDSGSGWPSFYEGRVEGAIDEHSDMSLGRERIEITCANCQSHLGHVFPDGPAPTGMRYCVNSASLDFEKS